MRFRLQDPFSGLTHLAGAALGAGALLYLVQKSVHVGTAWHTVSFAIFGASLIGLYLSSAFYHLLPVSEGWRQVLRRLDHTMIFLLIAGSYTPFCLVTLRENIGWPLLIVIWCLTALGIAQNFFWKQSPRWMRTGIYMFMGWIAVVAIYPLSKALSPEGMNWLYAGGAFYTVGAIVYAAKWPDPFPPHFGFHEIWHLFVLAGSASHFMSVRSILL